MSSGDEARASERIRHAVSNTKGLSFLALVVFLALVHLAVAELRGCGAQEQTFRCHVAQFIAG